MAQQCPLCGKDKPEKALFCSDCARKIESEYEVAIPDSQEQNEPIPDSPLQSETTLTSEEKQTESVEPAKEEVREDIPISKAIEPGKKGKSLWWKIKTTFIWSVAIFVVGISGFYVYENFIVKSNMERIDWDISSQDNTVSGYLLYIEKHPKGNHSDEAFENLKILKSSEEAVWERIKTSDNSAELMDFMTEYPESAFNSLVKLRLDSLMWIAAVNTNTAQSYSEYIEMSEKDLFKGDYLAAAQQRYDMLYQSYPVNSGELDSLRLVTDAFFIALSDVNYNKLNECLAPTVSRFFVSGTSKRDDIVRKLLMEATKTQKETVKYTPDINALAYEKYGENIFSCNVPFVKSVTDSVGTPKSITGYIAHLEMNHSFLITSVYETKPFTEAP